MDVSRKKNLYKIENRGYHITKRRNCNFKIPIRFLSVRYSSVEFPQQKKNNRFLFMTGEGVFT